MKRVRTSRQLPPKNRPVVLALLWRDTEGRWQGRVKRIADGKEVFVESLEALLRWLETEGRVQ